MPFAMAYLRKICVNTDSLYDAELILPVESTSVKVEKKHSILPDT